MTGPAEALQSEPRKQVILVVDDENGIREFLAAYLQSKNFKVITAGSAEEVFKTWPDIRNEVDLLITDIVMPGMNGKMLADRLAEEKESLRIIYMSGYLPEEVAEETLDGIFFRKPFHPQDLLAAVRSSLAE